jgi:hypothetical protein
MLREPGGQYDGPVSDSSRLPARSAVVALFVVAACAVLAAGGLAAVILADDRPREAVAGAVGRPSPTVRESTTRAVGPPLCVVGSWVVVEEVSMVKFYTDQPPLRMTSAGETYEFRPDGTGTGRLDGVVVRGAFGGNEIRMVGRGSYDFTWSATDKALTYLARTRSDASYTSYDQRGERGTVALEPKTMNEVYDHTCQTTRFVESSASGYRSARTRTTGSGVYG